MRVVDKSGLDNEIVTHANGHDWRRERERERELPGEYEHSQVAWIRNLGERCAMLDDRD